MAWRLRDYTSSPDVDFNNVRRLFFDRTGKLNTRTLYAQNTTTLADERLKLTYGAKYLYIDADFENIGNTESPTTSAPDVTRPNVSIPTDGGILPQLGVVFAASDRVQLFGNLSQNVNAYPYSPQSGVYNTSAQAFDFFKANTDPEKATTFEAGIRTRTSRVEASLALYAIDYRNRLIGVAVCPLTATCVSSYANVGDVATRGVETLVGVRLAEGLSWTSTASFNSSEIQDDYSNGTATVASRGKTVVDAPGVLLNSALRYNRNGVMASGAVRHVGKRYFSILNDMAAPAYSTVDASLGDTVPRAGALRAISVQLNALNLFDETFIATVGTGGFPVRGNLETLMAGQKRLFFLTVGTSF